MGRVSQSPGRYQTSMAGMVGAMIVLVACVLGFVVFREASRDVPKVEPEAIEWEAAAQSAADSGHPVVAPAALPEKWIATSIDFRPTTPPVFGLGVLTDSGTYAGLRQDRIPLENLLETYVDEETEAGDAVEVTGEFAGDWDSYTDEGGDRALVLDRNEDFLVVYGSASMDDLVEFASSLKTWDSGRPAPTEISSPTPEAG